MTALDDSDTRYAFLSKRRMELIVKGKGLNDYLEISN
jgi:hypothetical protein